jgi:GntR family transcriptional regulator
LRLADGEPMGVEESYLVHRYCRDILKGDYVSKSLRETLVQDYDIRWTHARQTIRAILAPRDLAELLAIRPKSALLFVERVSFSQQNIPVEFLRIYYRADRYVLYNELQG